MRRPLVVANPARLLFCRRCHTGHWLAGALPNAADPGYLCAACREQVREETPWCPDDAGGIHRDGCSCESAAPKMSAEAVAAAAGTPPPPATLAEARP